MWKWKTHLNIEWPEIEMEGTLIGPNGFCQEVDLYEVGVFRHMQMQMQLDGRIIKIASHRDVQALWDSGNVYVMNHQGVATLCLPMRFEEDDANEAIRRFMVQEYQIHIPMPFPGMSMMT